VQWPRKMRREMKMGLDIQALNVKGGGKCKSSRHAGTRPR
jgi:hypothetical protein